MRARYAGRETDASPSRSALIPSRTFSPEGRRRLTSSAPFALGDREAKGAATA